MKNQEQLNHYFSIFWQPRIEKRQLTGPALVNKVKDHEWVLDVGCGHNYFKDKIKNLVGIDPANDAACYKVCIEEFEFDRKFDVAFCLGSITFGSRADIRNDIKSLDRHLNQKARIYWRCNPGIHDHGNPEFDAIEVYPWTAKDHLLLAAEFGFTVQTVEWDSGNRIYAEWVRS